MSQTYTLQYFAVLREQARCREERVTTSAITPRARPQSATADTTDTKRAPRRARV